MLWLEKYDIFKLFLVISLIKLFLIDFFEIEVKMQCRKIDGGKMEGKDNK